MAAAKMLGLIFACVVFLDMLSTTLAQNSPQDYLDVHNTARFDVRVANITWNNTVQAYAKNYTDLLKSDCNLTISSDDSPYASILTKSTDTSYSGADAVKRWVSYKQYYTYKSNTCDSGREKQCGIYLQVVWRNMTQLGCGRAKCDKNAGVIIICSYYPPGNVDGEWPY